MLLGEKKRLFHDDKRVSITILNLYVTNNITSKYKKQKWTDLKQDNSTFLLGDVNTHTSRTYRTNRQNIGKDREGLNKAMNKFDLTDVDRMLHPAKMEFAFCKVHVEDLSKWIVC